MTVFGRVFAVVVGALAVVALVDGNVLMAVSTAASATGVLLSTSAAGRREAEHRAGFAQRLRAARREPQGVLVVRRARTGSPARRVVAYVDIDGEARGRLAAPGEASYPVPAGERSLVVRQPWSAGRAVTVVVPAGGSAVVEV